MLMIGGTQSVAREHQGQQMTIDQHELDAASWRAKHGVRIGIYRKAERLPWKIQAAKNRLCLSQATLAEQNGKSLPPNFTNFSRSGAVKRLKTTSTSLSTQKTPSGK